MALEALQPPPPNSKERDAKVKRTAIDLLDDCWFFRNMLIAARYAASQPVKKPLRREESSASSAKYLEDGHVAALKLLRPPSLPSPRVTREAIATRENPSPQRSSSPSLDSPTEAADSTTKPKQQGTKLSRSMTRPRPPRDSEKLIYHTNQQYLLREASFRKAFQEKKWKSLSDLEFEEVQGFRDLGFVFDKEGLNASLLKVIPGLREKNTGENSGESEVQRPYLSEAWLVQRSAPPVLKWAGQRSTEDVKEQLRSWARAVACNVRQEC